MAAKFPRVAVRAVIVHNARLLLVNAWPNGRSALLCAPGGGVEPGSSLPDNLAREVFEEVGLRVDVAQPCLVNEFHDPRSGFHQVEIFFRCTILGSPKISETWEDPENVVTEHIWASFEDMPSLKVKPDSLRDVAFGTAVASIYDPLETIVT